MTGLWNLHEICISNTCLLLVILAMSTICEVQGGSPWYNHPLELSFWQPDPRDEMLHKVSALCRGGSDDLMPLEGFDARRHRKPIPWRKIFRKQRGKLNIDFGKPKVKDPSLAEDETVSLAQMLRLAPSKEPPTNETQVDTKGRSNTNDDAEVKVSMDVFAMLRLAQHLGGFCQVAFAAGSATLKILGPMVMAQQLFERLVVRRNGNIVYNDPRAIEKSIDPTLKNHVIVESLRAVGRILVRFYGMYLSGILLAKILSAAPCAMPEQLCKYWYGLVWTIGVRFAAQAHELLFTKYFGLFEMRPEKHYFPLLPPTRLFQIPSLTVRWMYLFFGVVDNVLKVYSDEEAMSSQVVGPLFPSTWSPLQILNTVAMVHTMKQSLPEIPKAVTIGFCLQIAMYEEWVRVFLEERRVALGAFLNLASLLTSTYFIYVTTAVDRIAAGLLLPFGLASVIATWMNFVLCGREFAPSKRHKRPRYTWIE